MGVEDWIGEDIEEGTSRGCGGARALIPPGSDGARYVEGMVQAWADGRWRGSWPALAENFNRRFGMSLKKDTVRDYVIRQRPELYAAVRRR